MTRKKWLKWRQTGIGSSDAPAIHNKSPYATARDVVKSKWVKEPKEESSWAMDKGNEIEPILRAKFAHILGKHFSIENVDFQPQNLSMEELPHMLCSLDGLFVFTIMGDGQEELVRVGMEAKFMGAAKVNAVRNSTDEAPFQGIPENYWIQMQHQHLTAKLDHHFFVCTSEKDISNITEENIVWKSIKRDEEFLKLHIAVSAKIWKFVQTKKLPPPMSGDVEVITDKPILALAKKFKKLKQDAKKADDALEKARKALIDKCKKKHTNNQVGDIKVCEIEKIGNVDYSLIKELEGVNLDTYRKPSTKYWNVK